MFMSMYSLQIYELNKIFKMSHKEKFEKIIMIDEPHS